MDRRTFVALTAAEIAALDRQMRQAPPYLFPRLVASPPSGRREASMSR
jgi:hypothetical protein